MKFNKTYLFLFAVSSLALPLLLANFPVNQMPFEKLTLTNDPIYTKPEFQWKEFFADSVKHKNEVGNETSYRNAWTFRDKQIEDHFLQMENYANQSFGFRPFYVRMRNQIDYSIFGKAHAKSVIVGKDTYLYEEQYIKSVYGQDFLGQDSVNSKVAKLKYVQEELAKQGKLVFVVIAPGKGSFYPEFIPDDYGKKVGPTNYEAYTKSFKKNGINYIDFNDYFLKNKKTSKHVLYPKTGIHWSQYAMYHALDSMITYIEKKQNIDLRDVNIDDKALPGDELRFKDNDIEQGLNLFTQVEHLSMTYPRFSFGPAEGKAKPSLLTISDSFFWQMYDLGISHEVFNDGRFWFYNQTVHPDTEIKGNYVFANEMNLFTELQKRDVILLMCTEANLYKFAFGFIDDAESTLRSGLENYQKRIDELLNQMKSTPDWFAQIVEKAELGGISVEEQLLIDAQYMYKMESMK